MKANLDYWNERIKCPNCEGWMYHSMTLPGDPWTCAVCGWNEEAPKERR